MKTFQNNLNHISNEKASLYHCSNRFILCYIFSELKVKKNEKYQKSMFRGRYKYEKIIANKIVKVYNIAVATDHRLVPQIQVSITSALVNSDFDVKLIYHILVPKEMSESDKLTIKSIEKSFDNCQINIIEMGNEYNTFSNANGRLSSATYYRLSLPSLLPNVDKILWLDCDTLIRKDLTPIFSIDMSGLYFLGGQDYKWYKVFGHPDDRYVCAGVLLMNLKKMREDNLERKMKDFLVRHDKDADKQDQTAINSVGYDGIRFFPPKYLTFAFPFENGIGRYLRNTPDGNYTRKQLEEAVDDSIIIHMTDKPWKMLHTRYSIEWWKYARLTGIKVFKEIRKIFIETLDVLYILSFMKLFVCFILSILRYILKLRLKMVAKELHVRV